MNNPTDKNNNNAANQGKKQTKDQAPPVAPADGGAVPAGGTNAPAGDAQKKN